MKAACILAGVLLLFSPALLTAQEENSDLALAEALYDQGSYRQAVHAYDIAMINLLDDPFTLQRLSCALLQLDSYDRARVALERLLEVDPDNDIGRHNLGILFWCTDRPLLAIPCFEAIVARDSTAGDAWACLGYLYLETGAHEAVWNALDQLITLRHAAAEELQQAIVAQEAERNDPISGW